MPYLAYTSCDVEKAQAGDWEYNVFADLGHARPEEALAKSELAHKITEIIGLRQLTQAEAAVLLRVDQPKISALTRGRLAGFSLD